MAGIEKRLLTQPNAPATARSLLADLEGGVFTVTNGGISARCFPRPSSTHRRAPFSACMRINERPVAVNGQVVIRSMMYLALSYDHRLIDGKKPSLSSLK